MRPGSWQPSRTDLAIGMGLVTTPEYLEGRCDRRKTSPFPRLPRQRPAPLSTLGFFYGRLVGRAGCTGDQRRPVQQALHRGIGSGTERRPVVVIGRDPYIDGYRLDGPYTEAPCRRYLNHCVGMLPATQNPTGSMELMPTGLEVKQYNHYVYIMRSNPSGYIKIGRSVNVDHRRRTLQSTTHSEMEILNRFGYNASEDCAVVEKYFHVAYSKYKSDIHVNTAEWFKPEVLAELPTGRVRASDCMVWLTRYYPGFNKRFKCIWSDHNQAWRWIATRPYK